MNREQQYNDELLLDEKHILQVGIVISHLQTCLAQKTLGNRANVVLKNRDNQALYQEVMESCYYLREVSIHLDPINKAIIRHHMRLIRKLERDVHDSVKLSALFRQAIEELEVEF